jgi:ABC-2 type transport system ATP-binding protein
MIEELKHEKVTVLLSSHLLDQVQKVCDRVALFQSGRIVLMGTVPELAHQVLGGGFVVEIEAAMPPGTDLLARLRTINGVTSAELAGPNHFRVTASRDVRPDAARAVVAADGALTRLSVDAPSLDAIYTRFFEKQSSNGGVRNAA